MKATGIVRRIDDLGKAFFEIYITVFKILKKFFSLKVQFRLS